MGNPLKSLLFFLKINCPKANHAEYIVRNQDEFQPSRLLNVGMDHSKFQPCAETRSHSGVSYELCDPPNSVGTNNALVGYSIRLESNIARNTHLAFVTNGIALRMLEGGSGQGGQGTAFDEITVRDTLLLCLSFVN